MNVRIAELYTPFCALAGDGDDDGRKHDKEIVGCEDQSDRALHMKF